MYLELRVTTTDDGKSRIDAKMDTGLFASFCHFGTFDTIEETAEEAAKEILYQHERALEAEDDDA